MHGFIWKQWFTAGTIDCDSGELCFGWNNGGNSWQIFCVSMTCVYLWVGFRFTATLVQPGARGPNEIFYNISVEPDNCFQWVWKFTGEEPYCSVFTTEMRVSCLKWRIFATDSKFCPCYKVCVPLGLKTKAVWRKLRVTFWGLKLPSGYDLSCTEWNRRKWSSLITGCRLHYCHVDLAGIVWFVAVNACSLFVLSAHISLANTSFSQFSEF